MSELRSLELQNRYNRWMNEGLYARCQPLDPEVLGRDLGAFFKSILGTLNHLLLADRLWLGRFTAQPYSVTRLDTILYVDFETLRAERAATDQALTDYLASLTETDLDQPLRYTSVLSPEPRTLRLGDALLHVFHHQTHHRGQITTLFSQLGVDFGETDLLFIPGVVQRE